MPQQLAWLDKMVETRTPSGIASEWTTALTGACVVPFIAHREEQLQEFDTLSELYETDLHREPAGTSVSGRYEQRLDGWLESKPTQVKYLPLLLEERCTTPYLSGILGKASTKMAERDGTLVAVECQLYRRRHRAWPASVESLVPEHLESVPLDPFDAMPLRLVIINDRPFVYSVGIDRKDATAETPGEKLKEIDARDWQLFPPLDPTAGSEPVK
jgi:hypothetical protein